MIIDPKKNFYKNYVLSNGGMHIFRFLNTNFGSKWAGLWSFDKKLADYWAYRVNGTWLSMQNCFEFQHMLWSANHKHIIGDLLVTEELMPSKDVFISIIKVKNRSQSKVSVEIALEVGVNIRKRKTNSHNHKYELRTKRKFLEVKNQTGTLLFGTPDGKFVKKEDYGQHRPGEYAEYCGYLVKEGLKGSWNEDLQSKYIPGECVVEIKLGPGEEKKVPFFFSEKYPTGYSKYENWIKDSRKNYEKLRKQYRNVEYSQKLDKIISSLITFESDSGFIAGYPFFNEIWVRDACWCLPAYLYLGMFGQVKKFLKTVAGKIKDGKVPSLINSERCFHDSSDVTPLWVIGLYDYLDFTGDKKFEKSMLKNLENVLKYGKSRLQKDIVTSNGYTWMDSLERKKAIELQALWSRAFYCGGVILYLNGKNAAEYFKLSSRILSQIDKNYWKGIPRDNLDKDFRSPNFIFQLALMHISRDVSKQLSQITSKDYLTKVGIRSRPTSDKGYDPRGYHTGSVWPFLTLTAAIALCNYEKTEGVKKLLEINAGNFDKQCINGVNEFFYADELNPGGCTTQAWSVAGMITVLDGYFLGIKPKLTEKMIIFDPSKFCFSSFERNIKIGKKNVKINYFRSGKKMKLDIKNLPVKAKMPNLYSRVVLDGVETRERVINLIPKKSHSIVMEF
ncbi:MAG: hypothetical protein JSV92_04950 [archaeon]|nr:MAG: hypothetical protein JSV92_04950 [archaeon]